MNPRLTLIFMVVFAATTAGAALALDDAGKQAFMDGNCNRCHSISSHDIEATVSSERMKGPDLDGAGDRHDAAWIVQFVKREVQLNDKNHRMPWKGSDEDLQAIADWLASLKE